MEVRRTCGEPDEIGLPPMGVKLYGTRRVPFRAADERHRDVTRGG
jgi:hypothetical protein